MTETAIPVGRARASTARTPRSAAWRAVQNAPKPVITWALLAINVGIFVWMAAIGDLYGDGYLTYGANYGPATMNQHWRLLTSGFLHGSLVHLLFNVGALLDFGPMLERTAGRTKLIAVYVVSLFASSAASHAWSPGMLSIGASGATLGLAGYQFASPPKLEGYALFEKGYRKRMLAWLAMILFLGLWLPFDNSAHLGGFVCGTLIGFVSRTSGTFRRRLSMYFLATGALVALIAPLILLGNKRVQSDPLMRARAHYLLGIELLEKNQNRAALIELDEAVKLSGAAPIFERRAVAKLRLGDRIGAMRDALAGFHFYDKQARGRPWLPYRNVTLRELQDFVSNNQDLLGRAPNLDE